MSTDRISRIENAQLPVSTLLTLLYYPTLPTQAHPTLLESLLLSYDLVSGVFDTVKKMCKGLGLNVVDGTTVNLDMYFLTIIETILLDRLPSEVAIIDPIANVRLPIEQISPSVVSHVRFLADTLE